MLHYYENYKDYLFIILILIAFILVLKFIFFISELFRKNDRLINENLKSSLEPIKDASLQNDISALKDIQNSIFILNKKCSSIEEILNILKEKKIEEKNKNLEIGQKFEKYCGSIYEKKGYNVKYNGFENGKTDGGIDLIANKEDEEIYIQCKYWSKSKTIRENIISQLFGSAFKMAIDKEGNPEGVIRKIKSGKIKMVLMTKTTLSEQAKDFCISLNIEYKENMEIN